MTVARYVKSILITALVSVSLGGLLLHLRIHPPSTNHTHLIPMISGILSVILVPVLFSFRKTLAYGYVLNGFLAILGAVLMAHLSIANWPDPANIQTVLLKTTLPDILIACAKFFLGKALFDLETFGYAAERPMAGASFRYPNLGWWLVHFVGVSVVYALGHVLWS
jgi:hypothetical protein